MCIRDRICGGVQSTACILCVVGTILAASHVMALVVWELPPVGWWIALIVLYGETAMVIVAIVCMAKPSTGQEVRRSPETCFPVPSELLAALDAGELGPKGFVENVADPLTERTYCARCLVWRPDKGPAHGKPSHHCSTCQRCVVDFNHHCQFYARCVAGPEIGCEWPSGNYGWFGFLNCMALCLSLIHISEPTRLLSISYAVFCLKKKNIKNNEDTISKIKTI
eukprot:TRINITY_DN29193_c0_g1_i1.p1 TRINITY_DN29193_c0_g1~~TRINITY_DN29193_c0_g1_i1.p1  ORF type:complete len:224 (+),score=48.40 TRINITY_DN29193_c0_g1_i1:107-778(+)